MSEKKKLPLLATGKQLMPEVLPAPPARTGASPRERVLARLRQITSQTAALAAAATLSASDGCGYAVVDPLPMPAGAGGRGTGPWGPGVAGGSGAGATAAGSGGSTQGPAAGSAGVSAAGSGGVAGAPVPAAGGGGMAGLGSAGSAGLPKPPLGMAGYGVVDPMPNPARCADPSMLEVRVQSAEWHAFSVQVTFDIPAQSPFYLKTASAQPPVTVAIKSIYQLSLETSTTWPDSVSIDLGIECLMGMSLAVAHVTLKLDTSKPANAGTVPTQILRQ